MTQSHLVIKDIVFLIGIFITLVLGLLIPITINAANAYTKPAALNSQGIVRYDSNGDGDYEDSVDVVIDSSDFYKLYELCK